MADFQHAYVKPVLEFKAFKNFFDKLKDENDVKIGVYPPDYRDLFELYSKVRRSRAVSILEYGSGWSTSALALGLKENRESFASFVRANIRHPNPFVLMTVDASKTFLEIAVNRAKKILDVELIPVYSEVHIVQIASRIAHIYTDVPNFTSDFVYLDGPDSDQVKGSIFGRDINFGSDGRAYGLPMSADLLITENFFWPGSEIVIDGRGANASFLKHSFNRPWKYRYDTETDQHHFLLDEQPWGRYSRTLLELKNNPIS